MEDLIKLEKSFDHILFVDKDHSYRINGEIAKYSVTKLLKKYEKPFPRDEMAKHVARKKGVLIEDILHEWDYKRDYSSHRGSEFHLFAENYLQRRQLPLDKKAFISFITQGCDYYQESTVVKYYEEQAHLITNFLNFYNWWKIDHILVKPEFVVGDEEASVCGTIDNLSYNIKTKKFVIFDYKTNKAIDKKNSRGENLLPPFNYLPSCELSKYSLQLHLYKHIIEKNTGMEVGGCFIVWVNGKEDYELIECLDLSKEVVQILKEA
jgi:ATP-dependent exoDNAse (exonuclease V) beta subunit